MIDVHYSLRPMETDYQKMQADLEALQREVERLKEIERERQRS